MTAERERTTAARAAYDTLDEFYTADPEREASPEVDFGVFWTDRAGWPTWRVSWVQATGEIYAAELNHGGGVEVLGVIDGDVDARPRYRAVERALEGWAERCGQPGSLDWVRERLDPHRSREELPELESRHADDAGLELER